MSETNIPIRNYIFRFVFSELEIRNVKRSKHLEDKADAWLQMFFSQKSGKNPCIELRDYLLTITSDPMNIS